MPYVMIKGVSAEVPEGRGTAEMGAVWVPSKLPEASGGRASRERVGGLSSCFKTVNPGYIPGPTQPLNLTGCEL